MRPTGWSRSVPAICRLIGIGDAVDLMSEIGGILVNAVNPDDGASHRLLQSS